MVLFILMKEPQHDRVNPTPDMTFNEYADLAASSAQYMKAADPELVLRSGLIEEVAEVLNTDPENRDEFQKEIGDIIWYLSQIAQYKGLSLEKIANVHNDEFRTLGDFQAAREEDPTLPAVYSPEEGVYGPHDTPREFLAMGILRVIDVLNPQMDELWQGQDRPDISIILHEVLSILAQVTTTYDIDMQEAAALTLDKIKNRSRNPHVIDNKEFLITSSRERITVDPRIKKLLGTSVLKGNYALEDREPL